MCDCVISVALGSVYKSGIAVRWWTGEKRREREYGEKQVVCVVAGAELDMEVVAGANRSSFVTAANVRKGGVLRQVATTLYLGLQSAAVTSLFAYNQNACHFGIVFILPSRRSGAVQRAASSDRLCLSC